MMRIASVWWDERWGSWIVAGVANGIARRRSVRWWWGHWGRCRHESNLAAGWWVGRRNIRWRMRSNRPRGSRIRWHGSTRRVHLRQYRMDYTATANRNVSSRMHRQTMIERTEMHSVDCDLVLIHLDQHQHIERLPIADGTAAVTFLSAPHLVLQRVANDRRLVGPNADVQRDVITWIQCGSGLYVDLAPFSMVVDDTLDAHHRSMTKATRYEAQKRHYG